MSDLYDDPDDLEDDDLEDDERREELRRGAEEMSRRVREHIVWGYNARDILNGSTVIGLLWYAQPTVPWQVTRFAAAAWAGIAVTWLVEAGQMIIRWLREVTS